jgi:hypothetical protein
MPLFRDPDRRRHYLWSPDQDNREHPTTGSPQSQLNELSHHMFDASKSAGSDAEYMELSPSTELNLPPKPWANGREELIHRIKESSPWRHGHTVCLSFNLILAIYNLCTQKFLCCLCIFLSYFIILAMLTYLIVPG